MDSDEKALNDAEIQELLNKSRSPSDGASPASDSQPVENEATESTGGEPVEDRANQLLNEVDAGLEAAMSDAATPADSERPDVDAARPFELADLGDQEPQEAREDFSIGMLDDVQLNVQIELGRAELLIDEVLAMREGVVIPLDKLAGDPIDIVVNGRLLARGEVLVLNDNFCVRVAEIVDADF